MKLCTNKDGFALVTALMMTMLTLVIAMGIMYMVTQNIRAGGIKKAYQNAVEASYGGADVAMYNILPSLFSGVDSVAEMNTAITGLGTLGAGLAFNVTSQCLIDKLSKSPADWVTSCGPLVNSASLNPATNPDFTMTLNGAAGQAPYVVNSKIVDTVPGVPYATPPVGGPLLGAGSTSPGGSGSGVYVAHYVYRIEVAAQRQNNATEQGAVSVLYEY